MPFPFTLPTTSSLSFPDFYTSATHPSLPLSATTHRGVLRDTLKKHKRLPPASQPSNLPSVLSALNAYIPYLFALDAGLGGRSIAGEEVDVVLVRELEVEWRATLSASIPGREASRVKLKSLESELCFVLLCAAEVHALLARSQLHTLYNATMPTADQRATAIAAAMRHFLDANAVCGYLVSRVQQWAMPPVAVDISVPVLSALGELTIAEATLITVLKDDPYPGVVLEDRNKQSKDWMFKSVEIPKVRAHLFARLCLSAAEHAAKAQAMLSSAGKVDEGLVKYVDDLRRTARGKACRFLGIDAELAGKTGEGIAWVRGARRELGFQAIGKEEERKGGTFSKLKKDWAEKREDRKVEKGGDWGTDGGKFEEGRVLEMLERKWVKMNDTVGVQLIPPSEPLLASMPSGREYHTPKLYITPSLDEDVISPMRAPPDPSESGFKGDEDDSNDEDENKSSPVGAFPGTKGEYSGGTTYY
ncbi:pH-response regulator protein palC [Mytilinidion resinicola]|uniref:pH-response regulator protein palC n=1 Tax=Mytilinidion resinicola TaxID=574789 RepID=A0A6A6YJB6_9PEZI|nr:pH-response regulator protein palC [Mytilinidion resinicola]KAF2808613.1 pH-response regulator protein palC [Mytilinidion resinicola]